MRQGRQTGFKCHDDVPSSGFAITGHLVHGNLGGDEALARHRHRLSQCGLFPAMLPWQTAAYSLARTDLDT